MRSCRIVSPWWGCHLAGSRASPATVWSERPVLQTRCSPCLSNSSATGWCIKGYPFWGNWAHRSCGNQSGPFQRWNVYLVSLYGYSSSVEHLQDLLQLSSIVQPFSAPSSPSFKLHSTEGFSKLLLLWRQWSNGIFELLIAAMASLVVKKYEDIKSHGSRCLMPKASGEFYLFAAWSFFKGCEEQERKLK